MRVYLGLLSIVLILSSCVPAKKYNELLAREKNCQEQLQKYKTQALNKGGELETVKAQLNLLKKDVEQLKKDTTELGRKYRNLYAKYRHSKGINSSFAEQLKSIKNSDKKHLARLRSNLEAKMRDVQAKEDQLDALEKKLNKKETLLAKREQRIQELEHLISQQKNAVQALKDKIADALLGFRNKGLTVTEKNGKIYVSLAEKLLFGSGSIKVAPRGKKAVIQLAKSLVGEDGIEVIVEGHTDNVPLHSTSHPRNNWELSVLRATSVVEIMVNNTKINPAILSASGRSKYHPISKTDKAKNRRIDVIISPNLNKLFKIISDTKLSSEKEGQ